MRRPLSIAFALALAGCALYLGVELSMAGRLGPSIDDGWIYMAFARAFLEGDPFSYPGHQGPVSAITGTAWCFALTGSMLVLGAGPLAMKIAGVLAALFAVFGAFRLARAATGDARVAAATAIVVACTPRVLWGALSGMEAAFATGAVAFGIALHLERRSDGIARWAVAALVLALAGWARPECFVFLPIAALHRRRADAIVAAVVLLAAYPVYNQLVFGHPLPTTFYAKAAGGSPLAALRNDGLAAGLGLLSRSVGLQLAAFVAWLPSFLPFVAPAALLGVRRGLRERDGVPFVAAALVLFALARGALGFQAPSFQQGRYFVQLWPLFLVVCLHGTDLRRPGYGLSAAVLAMLGVGFLLQPGFAGMLSFDWIGKGPGVADQGVALWSLALGPAIAVVLLATAGSVVGARGDGRIARPPVWIVVAWLAVSLGLGAVRHGQGVRDTYELNVAMAEAVAREVPEGEAVACHDIGALGWFSRRPLLDLAGLGSPDVAMGPRGSDGVVDVSAVVQERKPRFVCVTPEMMDRINPRSAPLRGIRSFRSLATVSSDHNVTVLGDAYFLVELEWDR